MIYIITSQKCRIQYVGQTSNSLSMRMTAHINDIKHNENKTIARHFNLSDHPVVDLKVSGLTKTSKNGNTRLRHEEAIICIMGTGKPSGLNIMS